MNDINLPPFYVGQRVVAVSSVGKVIKGQMYIILDQVQCPKCKKWQVGYRPENGDEQVWGCPCGFSCSKDVGGPFRFAFASRFAPIQENFHSISLEKILEKETKLIGVN